MFYPNSYSAWLAYFLYAGDASQASDISSKLFSYIFCSFWRVLGSFLAFLCFCNFASSSCKLANICWSNYITNMNKLNNALQYDQYIHLFVKSFSTVATLGDDILNDPLDS